MAAEDDHDDDAGHGEGGAVDEGAEHDGVAGLQDGGDVLEQHQFGGQGERQVGGLGDGLCWR